jgi:hypothetical protein
LKAGDTVSIALRGSDGTMAKFEAKVTPDGMVEVNNQKMAGYDSCYNYFNYSSLSSSLCLYHHLLQSQMDFINQSKVFSIVLSSYRQRFDSCEIHPNSMVCFIVRR